MKKLGRLSLNELENKIPVIPQVILEQIKGGDISVVFDRSDSMIYIYDWGNCIGSYPATNIVNSGAIWQNGTYSMQDQWDPRGGNGYEGNMGSYGGFAAENFYDPVLDRTRTGMMIHSGYGDNFREDTAGCIRTTDAAIWAIDQAIVCGGAFYQITVQD